MHSLLVISAYNILSNRRLNQKVTYSERCPHSTLSGAGFTSWFVVTASFLDSCGSGWGRYGIV